MTSDTIKLHTFIKTHFHNSAFSMQNGVKGKGKKDKLSEMSKTLIGKIVGQMEPALNSWKMNETFTYHTINTGLPKGEWFHIIDKEIRQSFENLQKIGKQYSFMIGSRKFHVYLIQPIYPNIRSSQKTISMFDKMVQQIYIWLFIASHFAGATCSRELSIYIYLTDLKKNISEILHTGEPLLPKHVNTAFTSACPRVDNNTIYIYRKEEWFKVFIHETFHSLGLDFATMSESVTQNAMFSIFPVNYDLRFYEMYCELWAEIINVLFICVNNYRKTSAYYRSGGFNMNVLCKMVEEEMHTEQIFSIFQCVKILRHFDLNYTDLYDKTADSARMRYREKTSVFSYYILKSIAMYFYNDFIEWCVANNEGSIHFKKTIRNTLQLVNFIKQKYNSPAFLKAITTMEHWFENHTRGNNSFCMRTMRMSISDSRIE